MRSKKLLHQIVQQTELEFADVQRVLDAMATIIMVELQTDQVVTIPGLGKLLPATMGGAPRRARAVMFQPNARFRTNIQKRRRAYVPI